jgi:ketosteroid isomerase-like protein
VRFLRHSASENLAYQSGYFRQEATLPDGKVRISFTRFEFILRKEGARWKILVDKDSGRSEVITEEDFSRAAPLTAAPR